MPTEQCGSAQTANNAETASALRGPADEGTQATEKEPVGKKEQANDDTKFALHSAPWPDLSPGADTAPAQAQWQPTRPVEFIIPAGTGGGADLMARTIQGIVTKHNLMKSPMVVINKAGGAGGEGFLDVKNSRNNPHKIIITLSNLFTTPLATGIPFNWKDLTPVAMLALDEFVLWVNAETPYKTVEDYISAVKKAPAGQYKMGGTGSRQEDQIITVAIEKSAGVKFTYIPFRGGGEVAVQLVGNHVNSTVNNPNEAIAQWRGGKVRPLCVFDGKPLSYNEIDRRQACHGTAFRPARRKASTWNT